MYIISFSNLLTLSLPDEGYFRNASYALNLIFAFFISFYQGTLHKYTAWIYWLIDWLVFNTNFSSISAILSREQIVLLN